MTKTSRVAVVLDTNVLLVALPQHSPYRPIFDKLLTGAFNLVISNEILMEYEEQITERYDLQTSQDLMIVLSILPNIQKIIPYFRWQLIVQDPDDDKFVDAAISANVDYLVTNDRHFNILKSVNFPKVPICDANSFLTIIRNL